MAAAALSGSASTVFLVLFAAFAAGFIDSIVGGGGLIQVPALLTAYPDVAARDLLGTNKFGSIFGTTSSVARYARFVRIPWRLLLPAGGCGFLAAVLGASLVSQVPSAIFRPMVPVALAAVLVYVLTHKDLGAVHAPLHLDARRRLLGMLGVAGIGVYDGFFGPGTGSFLMLLYVRVHGFDFLNAAAAARLVNVATNAGALTYFGLHAHIHWSIGAGIGLCNASGSVVGVRTARRHGGNFVRRVFIAVVSALIAKTAWDGLRG
ncbi:MAG: TSUP family transporter [Steroidobacteraceae bacterium]